MIGGLLNYLILDSLQVGLGKTVIPDVMVDITVTNTSKFYHWN
jgi:membrane-bound lytic murein transglycosylase MltF